VGLLRGLHRFVFSQRSPYQNGRVANRQIVRLAGDAAAARTAILCRQLSAGQWLRSHGAAQPGR
jgi:hypothetical protein